MLFCFDQAIGIKSIWTRKKGSTPSTKETGKVAALNNFNLKTTHSKNGIPSATIPKGNRAQSMRPNMAW